MQNTKSETRAIIEGRPALLVIDIQRGSFLEGSNGGIQHMPGYGDRLRKAPQVIDTARGSGIVINGLPIINDRPQVYGFPPFPDLDLYYEDCVIGGPGSFMVVADGFKAFARAVLRKLVTEIAGRTLPQNLIWLAAARPRPPCNAGEMQLQEFLKNQTWQPPTPLHDF